MQPSVAFVGLSGAGKTTIGARVAAALKVPFQDLDDVVEQVLGTTISEVFDTRGEEAFRDAETAALTLITEREDRRVLATGGGVVLREANRTLLRAHFHVVWLDLSPELAAERLADASDRPLLTKDPVETLRGMDRDRRALYQGVAHTHFPLASGDLVEEVASRLTARLSALSGES